jgi:GNAT superfamily N-acetyltransferase
MTIKSRAYNKKEDFKPVMKFLAELYQRTKSYENWFPDRFENSSESREDGIQIWEEVLSKEKLIVGLTTRDSSRDFFLHVDPNYRHVEKEMIEWIMRNYDKIEDTKEKKGELRINILEGNKQREELLSKLGFRYKELYGYYRIRKGKTPNPDYKCPENFEIRTIKREEFHQQAKLIQRVFGHGEWFTAEILEWIAGCSFYREELDLVAVTSEGVIASFCTFRVDPISKIISLEPMGTNPDYRKLGLGKAILSEGFRRSEKYNPPFFYIDGAASTPAANQLYDVTGFTEKYAINSWVKEF